MLTSLIVKYYHNTCFGFKLQLKTKFNVSKYEINYLLPLHIMVSVPDHGVVSVFGACGI